MRIEQCNGDLQVSLNGTTKCLQAGESTLSWQTLSEYSFQIQKQDGYLQMIAPSATPIQKNIQNGWVWQYDHAELTVEVQYVLDGNVLLKTVSVTANEPLVIRYAQTEVAAVREELTRGGEGQPLFIGTQGFISSTFPAAENRRDGSVLNVRHAPFKSLNAGQRFDFSSVVYGLNMGRATFEDLAESFRKFLLQRRPHPNDCLRVYCDWGAHDELAAEYELELDEKMARRLVANLRNAKEKLGLTYDYYLMDDFWYDPESYFMFKRTHWPEGPKTFLHELEEAGMKLGLWFDANMQRVSDANKKVFRSAGNCELCMAVEANAAWLFDAIEKHIREDGVRMLKFDFAYFECDNPNHDFHSQRGIASKEPAVHNFIKHIHNLREICPELQVLGYNGFSTKLDYIGSVDQNRSGWAISPFWALYIDYLYCGDPRPAERAAPMEKSIVHYSDCMIEQFTDALLPREAIDDHGSMIGLTNTIYYLQKRSLRDSYLMNIVRGTRKIHLYGETGLLDDEDWEFLTKAQKLFDFVCSQGCKTEPILERPSRGTVYGYHNALEDRGVITVVNTTAIRQPIVVNVPGKLRWKRIYHAGNWCEEILPTTGALDVELDGYGIDAYVWERLEDQKTEALPVPIARQCIGGYVDMDPATTVIVPLPADCKRIGIRFMTDELSPLRAANEERSTMRISAQGAELTRLDTMAVWSGISFAIYDVRMTEDVSSLQLDNSGDKPLTLHWQVLESGKE